MVENLFLFSYFSCHFNAVWEVKEARIEVHGSGLYLDPFLIFPLALITALCSIEFRNLALTPAHWALEYMTKWWQTVTFSSFVEILFQRLGENLKEFWVKTALGLRGMCVISPGPLAGQVVSSVEWHGEHSPPEQCGWQGSPKWGFGSWQWQLNQNKGWQVRKNDFPSRPSTGSLTGLAVLAGAMACYI